MSEPFTEAWLADRGFEGWVQLRSLEAVSEASIAPGIYAVVHNAIEPVEWVRSCGGWFKGRDPNVATDRLEANWVPDASTVYLGKAGNLRRRLLEFAKFGRGDPIGHWGGRLIWQLPLPDDLKFGWRIEPTEAAALAAETELIGEFVNWYGKPPFGNRPERNGA